MLKIHKPFSKKLLRISIASICITSGLLGFYALTYTPELSHAKEVTYEPKETRTLADITYMQEINVDICKNTPEATSSGAHQYRLTDSRPNSNGVQPSYWVAKLKDGNCWMTQNLDLDIPSTGLSKNDTDILEDWNSLTNSKYPPAETAFGTTAPWGFSNLHQVTSWNPGEKGTVRYCSNNTTELCNLTSSRNGGHDAQGNYYSYNAALAGKGAGDGGTVDDSSICPKRWKLPLSSDQAALFNSYGAYQAGTLLYGGQSIIAAPIYYVKAGYAYQSRLNAVGDLGLYWLSEIYNSDKVYALSFSASVNPATKEGRYGGTPIRCVARNDVIEKPTENNVVMKINPTISIDVTDEINVEKSDINPSTAAFSALVASNQPYSVSISSNSPNMTSSTSDVVIPSKSGTLTSSENAWGIKLSTTSTYEQITTTPKLFYSSTSPESKSLPFTIGISTAPDIPNGEYSTNITITATQN